jgi:hypothetical protein
MAIARPDASSTQNQLTAEASVDPQSGEPRKRDPETVRDAETVIDDSDELEPFDPGDDSDLGLSSLEDEDVGLDTSLGFDDASDDLDMPELNDDEEGGWDADADDASELPDTNMELEDGEGEFGWIGDDETGSADDDFTDDLDDEPEASGDDGGAEGLEDESEIDDLDLADLPALDKDSEEEIGLPGLDGVDELAAYGLLDEPVIEIAPGHVWKMLRPGATRTTRVAWPADCRPALINAMSGTEGADGAYFARSLAVHNQSLYLAAGALYRLDPSAEVFSKLPLRAAEAQQLVVAEHEGAVHILAVARGQLLVSADAGASFAPHPASYATHAGFTYSGAGLRLWWRSAEAEIGSDSQIARAEGRVLAAHTDGRRSIAWLSRADKLLLTASADGGKSFVSWPAPAQAQGVDDHDLRIETCGDALLLSAAGQLWCGQHGSELAAIATCVSAREPASLADEEGDPSVFACVERQGEWLLIRRAARGSLAAPIVLAALGPKQLGEPLALAVGYGEGGLLSVFVACEEGVLRIEASLDGEELA